MTYVANTTENTPLDATPEGAAAAETGEGTVNWDSAKEVFQPKSQQPPGEGEEVVYVDDDGNELSPEEVAALQAEGQIEVVDDEGAGKPEMVEVRIKGRTITLPREDAEAFESFRRETRERDGRMGGELQQTRERLAALEAVVKDRHATSVADKAIMPEKPDAKLALSNFPEYEKQHDEWVERRIALAINEVVHAYNEEKQYEKEVSIREQANRAWVSGFYTENKHLNKPTLRPTVGQVYRENQNEIDSYGDDVESAYARLAELAEARLTELATQGRTLRRPPEFQGAGQRTQVARPSPRDSTPFSTANWIAKERALMKGEKTE